MKIVLIGAFPPPFGGIAIHIKRLYSILKKDADVEILTKGNKDKFLDKNIKDYKMKTLLLKFPFLSREEIFHFHYSNINLITTLGILNFLFRKKVVVTIHNNRLSSDYEDTNILEKFLFDKFIKYISQIILVSQSSKDFFLKHGAKEKNICIIPAYLNPVISKEDYEKIDKEVWKFISDRKKCGYKVITGNGNISFFKGKDLYGLDLFIELIYRLKVNGYNASLVFVLIGYNNQNLEEKKYFENLKKLIKELKIKDRIFIYKAKNTEYYPIIDVGDIFIRPTNTDGDSISIREALFLKKPCISSDVVKRPKGVITFKNRNIEDLYKKTKFILEEYHMELEKMQNISSKEYSKEIIDVYARLCKQQKTK